MSDIIKTLHTLTSWNGAFPVLPPLDSETPVQSDIAIELTVAADVPLVNLSRVLLSRRSVRSFSPQALSLSLFSQILKYACGTRKEPSDPQLRTYPSAGALFDVGIHIVAQRVEGLEPGIYEYEANTHSLKPRRSTSSLRRDLQECFGDGEQLRVASEATFLVVMTIPLQRLGRKYGARAYRFALQESGHIAQNLALVAEGLHCGAVSLGAFLDEGATALISDDQLDEKAIYIMALGVKANQVDLDASKVQNPAVNPLEHQVLQILAGQVSNAPQHHHAVEVYRQAGRDALDRLTDNWLHWRIHTESWNLMVDADLQATLLEMKDRGWIKGFWHLHKSDGGHHLRLRIQLAIQAKRRFVEEMLEASFHRLLHAGKLSSFHRGAYDPEVQLFGGQEAMDLVHEVFMLESLFFPQLISKDPSLAYRASLLWLDIFFRSLGMDNFEKWDVWKKVSRFRSFASQESLNASPLIPLLRGIASLQQADIEESFCDLVPDGASILPQLIRLGQRLNLEASRAAIKIRASCSILVVFHWNRLQLDGPEQATLCQLWTEAIHPHGNF